jgi:hypothetical protein
MKFRFRQPEERLRAKVLFVMLSQFSTTTFSVPVRKFRSLANYQARDRSRRGFETKGGEREYGLRGEGR